jgi:lipopolysaccharide transport system permease protein
MVAMMPSARGYDAPEVSTILIEPSRSTVSLKLAELWAYRELLYFLVWRDVKVRYKQTLFGAAWAVLQPVLTMVVFSVFFGRLARVPSDGIPYPIFAYAGLVPWTLFAYGLNQGTNSVVGGAGLVKKVYFPRLCMPLAAVLSGIVDFVLALLTLFVLGAYYGVPLSWRILALPVFVLLTLITALAVALWLSALNVHYRDVRFVVPFLVQTWFFATPIAYPSSLLSEPWRTLYGLNPMVGVVEGFRWALLNVNHAPGPMVWVSAGVAVALLVSGAYYFRRMEKTFADKV